MGVSGEIKYEGFKVYLQLSGFGVDLGTPIDTLAGYLSMLRPMPVGITVDIFAEGGQDFEDLIRAKLENFRQFLDDSFPRDLSNRGIMVFEGGATVSSGGEVTFQGETRRPTPEDYQDLSNLTASADEVAKAALLEHCKTCPSCAEKAGLPPIHHWGNTPSDEEIH